MTGVEILAMKEIVTAYKFDMAVYFITIGAISVSMMILALLELGTDLEAAAIGLVAGALFGIILGLFPASSMEPSEYEVEYKVMVSDEVSINDFLERYEIISKEGKIYTVRERNEVSE